MKSVLVCNQKGGVGKSLIADELAFSFERSGIPLAFYDLDTQGGTIHKTVKNEKAEIVIIDTPGALLDQLKDWLKNVDIIVIPTRPTSRDIEPLQRMRKVVGANAPDTPVLYVVNGWNRYKASADFMDWLMREISGIYTLPQSEQFVQASASETSVVSYAKNSPAAKSILNLCNSIRTILGFPAEREK